MSGISIHGYKKVINTPLIPDQGHERTGEVVTRKSHTGQILEFLVYRELKPEHMRSEQVVVRDPEGRIQYHPSPIAGQNGKPFTRRVESIPQHLDDGAINPEAYREYILSDDGAGNVSKNFYFREDPAVVARLEREAARKAKADELLDALSRSDMDADALLEALGAQQKDEEPEPEKESALPDAWGLEQAGRWFYVTRNGERYSDTGMEKQDAELILAEKKGERDEVPTVD